jgi:2'-5' RNA ligase
VCGQPYRGFESLSLRHTIMYNLDTRLYVEYIPSDASRPLIAALAEQAKPQVKARFVDPAKWHVTIMHFGIARQVYEELLDVLPDLKEEVFLSALEKYIETTKQTLPPPISLKATGYELLGRRGTVLAVRFELIPEVKQAHLTALQNLKTFFNDIGLHDSEAFMRRSQNFSWALTVKPHLTIARGVLSAEPSALPTVNTSVEFACADVHGI